MMWLSLLLSVLALGIAIRAYNQSSCAKTDSEEAVRAAVDAHDRISATRKEWASNNWRRAAVLRKPTKKKS